MKRRKSLKPDEPLLVGNLFLVQGGKRTPPHLLIHVWCPYCKQQHEHGWPGNKGNGGFEADRVTWRVAHCVQHRGTPRGFGPGDEHGYWIGLDPSHAAKNRSLWESLEGPLAESRKQYAARGDTDPAYAEGAGSVLRDGARRRDPNPNPNPTPKVGAPWTETS